MASTDFHRTDNSLDAGGLNDTSRTFRHENKMEMFLLRRFPRNIYHDIRFYCRCWDVREGSPPVPLLAVLTGRALFTVPVARTAEGQRGRHPALHTAISLTDVTDVRVEHEAPSHLRLPPNTCCHVVSLSLRDKQIDKETSSFRELESPRPGSQISTHSTPAFWRPGRRTPLKPLLENVPGSAQERKLNRKPETRVHLLVLGPDHELARHLQTCWHAHLQRATLALAEMIDNQRPQGLSLRSYFRCGALWKDERLPLLLSSRLQQLLKRGRREVWFEDEGFGKEAGEQSPAGVVLLLLSWLLDSLRSAECAEARDQVLGRGTGTLLQNLLLLAVYVGGQSFGRANEVSEEELHLGYVTAAIITELLESCRRLKFSCPNLLAGADIAPFMSRSGSHVLTILRPRLRVSPMRSASPSSMPSGLLNPHENRPSSQLSLPVQLLQNNNNWTNFTAYRLDAPHLTPERAVQLLQQLYAMKQLTDHLEVARNWLKTSFREELRYYLRWDAVSPKIPDRYPVKQLIPSLLDALRKCAGIAVPFSPARMSVRNEPQGLGLGDGRSDPAPQVIRNTQHWEENFKNYLGLVVVEFYPSWAAPSTALANSMRRLRPKVTQESLQVVAMPTDLAKCIFRLSTKPSAGIALAYRGRLLQKLPSWDLNGLKKAVIEFFNRGEKTLGGWGHGPGRTTVRTFRADYAAPKLIRNLANAVRASRAVERMKKQMQAPDDMRPPPRWQPPQYKSK